MKKLWQDVYLHMYEWELQRVCVGELEAMPHVYPPLYMRELEALLRVLRCFRFLYM